MRVVSFVNPLEFEFEGTVCKNAVCLGDIDNDGQNELVVGNEKGTLAIFKGEKSHPVEVIHVLGMLTAVAVGDVCNLGHNVLVAVTGCGICYIYDFENGLGGDPTEKGDLQPIHVQHIPANVKDIIIEDINGDGLAEMVVGLTDRVVRTYRWMNAGNIVGGKTNGKLVGLHKWELVDQIGNISSSECPDGTPSILVAQPGGTYFALKPGALGDSDQDSFDENMSVLYHGLASSRLRNPQIDTQIVGNIKLDFYVCSSERSSASRSNSISGDMTECDFPVKFGFGDTQSDCSSLGKFSVNHEEEISSRHPSTSNEDHSAKVVIGFAVATLDGTLMLVHNNKIQWNLQVDHQIFSVHALDVTGDDREEVVACAWDGNTYIVCQNTDCVRFSFPHPVSTFKAGRYGIRGKQVPSLVYVTFHNRIYLYPDISMPHLVTTSVTELLKKEPRYHRFLDKIGVDVTDKTLQKEINHFLLYGRLK
ncbi:integrin alpha FG-GAP repeat-containing protein 2 [Halocaridina rubra]|uniref:Integrin alpha FG-GAP repeat-containing protein 2 n=1 Tax=Halocaridina rubra TaxID=373956 RepID=A0AAN9ABB7_HALRR